jgi:hypothetical protein
VWSPQLQLDLSDKHRESAIHEKHYNCLKTATLQALKDRFARTKSTHPHTSTANFEAEDNVSVKMPKKKSPEEAVLKGFLEAYALPDVSSFSIEEIEAAITQMTTDVKTFLNELIPPPKPYVNARLEKLNSEFKTLSKLSKAHNPVEIAKLVATLTFSKAIVSTAPTNRSVLKRARRHIGLKARKVQASERCRRERSEAKRQVKSIKHLFDRGEVKEAWERVKDAEDAGKCPIPGEALFTFHKELNQGAKSSTPRQRYNIDPITSIPEIAATRPRACTPEENAGKTFTEAEIIDTLKHANKNSAAGPDKLTLKLFILGGDNFVKFIARLFERLRVLRVIPGNWKFGEIQVAYKKGDKMLPANWRPITLLCALYKLFTACLDRRLHQHDRILKDSTPNASLFSLNQRGFRPRISGCTDNVALLRRLEAVAQRTGDRKLFQLYIDFKNAFGSPDHDLIFLILDWFNIPAYIADLMSSAYDGSTIKVRFGDNKLTPAFAVEKGTFQGDPISPALFALCVELLIRLLNTLEKVPLTSLAFVEDAGVNNEAYADDMVGLALTDPNFELISRALYLFCTVTDIGCNATKTVSTVTVYKSPFAQNRTSYNPNLQFGPEEDVRFPGLEKTETYTYLGAESAGSGKARITTKRLRDILVDRGKLIERCGTVGYVKSGLFQMFVLPKVNYTLSCWTLKASQLASLDKVQRKLAKAFEGLRASICNAAVHANKPLGGLGYMDMAHAQLIAYVPAYLRRLFLADREVQGAERCALMSECLRLSSEDASARELWASPELLVSKMDKFTPSDLACGLYGLSLVPGLSFAGSPYVVRSLGLVLASDPDQSLPFLVAKSVALLKEAVGRLEREAWAGMEYQGAPLRALDRITLAPRAAQSPHMTRPRCFSSGERRFQFLSQCNGFANNRNLYSWNLSPTDKCRRCPTHIDTTLHTFNNCLPRLHLATDRHNAVHDVLKKELAAVYPAGDGFDQRSDVCPDSEFSPSSLRPDETIVADFRNKRNGDSFALIVDVKCPFPQDGFIFKSDLKNQIKYHALAEQYKAKLGRATVLTLILPSTGPTPMFSLNVLLAAGVGKRRVCKVLREMSIAVTKANYAFASTLPSPTRTPH